MKNNLGNIKLIFLILGIVLLSLNSFGQLPTFQFVKGIPGAGTTKVHTDLSGNIYVAGIFQGTNVDFNPGPGLDNLSSNGGNDIYIAKYSPTGNYIWAKNIGNANSEELDEMIVDASGNMYIIGTCQSAVDFDPSAATYTIGSASSSNNWAYVAKYDNGGSMLWAKSLFSSGGSSQGHAISIYNSQYIYITGTMFNGPIDFDFGPSTSSLTAASAGETFIAKYDLNAAYQWAIQISSFFPNYNYGNDISVDASGNCCVVGRFNGTASFNPSTTTNTLSTPTSPGMYMAKYSPTGTFVWTKGIGIGATTANGLNVDCDGTDFYLAGNWSGTNVDFDPGPGTALLSSAGSNNLFYARYDAAGAYIFAKGIGTAGVGFVNNDVFVKGSGAIYITGSMGAPTGGTTVDFNPATATNNLTTPGSSNTTGYFAKYDLSGNYKWAFQNIPFPNTDNSAGYGIFYDGSYVYWSCWGNGVPGSYDYDPSPAVNTYTNINGNHFAKYSDCTFAPVTPGSISGNNTICNGSINTYSIAYVSGATSYSWSLPGGWTGTSSTITISTTASSTSGNLTVTATNGCGTSAAQVLSVTVNALPTISVNSGSICSGSSFTMVPSGASTYTFSSGSAIVSPTSTTSYSVTGTSSAGCVGSNTAVASVTVNSIPVASASTTQTLTCVNTTAVLNGSGVSTYTWSGPGIVSGGNTASPVVNMAGTYSLVGSTSGCNSNTATVVVSTNTVAPTLSVTVSSTSICTGNSATLTASGANTYSWSASATTTSVVVSPTTTTNYILIGTNSVNGCSGSINQSVGVNPLPTVIANTSNSVICGPPFQGTATLTAGGANTYVWNTSATTTTISVSPSVTTVYTVTGTDGNGCVNMTSFTQSVSACTGLEQFRVRSSEFVVYPNPTSGSITIKVKEGLQVQVYTIIGELILSTELKTETAEIDLSNQANGIYFVRIGSVTKKIIKE